MKLFWSSRSPFVRKVMVAAHEAGVAARIKTERVVVSSTALNPDVMAVNPINKIPTLVADDGTVIYDSRAICEYFDFLAGGSKLFPTEPAARWRALRWQSLGDGMMEMIVLRLAETKRNVPSEPHLIAFRQKIASALDSLEADAGVFATAPITVGHVSIAAAIGHLEFRFADDQWRNGRPQFAAWYVEFSARPSMRATEYQDVY